MLVSLVASWQGNSGLAVGNALGSNIINMGLILGITAMVIPLKVHSSIIKRELPVLLLVMVIALLLLLDGTLGRLDGMILLTGMALVVIWLIRHWFFTQAGITKLYQLPFKGMRFLPRGIQL